MPKRGENIYKRKDGRWEGRIKKCRTSTGRYEYQSIYGKSYKEVKVKMDTARQMQREDIFSCNDTMEYAAKSWMQAGETSWKSSTYAAYQQIIKKYILPYLGQMRINEINRKTLEDFVDKVSANHSQQISRNYASQICNTIRRILIYMNKENERNIPIPDNPVMKGRNRQAMLPGEASLAALEKYLLAHCEEDTCLGILIALHTGIRIGELSALMWKDINLEERVIYIRRNLQRVKRHETDISVEKTMTRIVEQTPKTSDSFRIIPIPPRLLPLLMKYQKEDSCYLVSGEKKAWAEPRTIQYRFKGILQKSNIEYFNFHMLRHAFATNCVSMGLDVKSLSEILGHSNIQVTLNLYVHPSIRQKKLLMEQYDILLQKRGHSHTF